MNNKTEFKVEKINERIYMISEYGISNAYLVIGDEKSLLIDCGIGIGNIAGCVKSLTDKPIILAATHAHVDHIGAAHQFGKIYIHKNDLPMVRFQSSHNYRCQYMKKHPSTRKYNLDPQSFAKQKPYLFIIPFGNHHKFDLGNITVEAILTPGHSSGSVCYKIDTLKILFVGDNYIPILNFRYAFGSVLTKWLKKTKELFPLYADYAIYGGHGQHPVSYTTIKWQQETVEKIISSTEANKPRSRRTVITINKNEDHASVIYRTDRIL